MATSEKLPGSAEWNIPLMHRVAELLMSYDAESYRAIDVAVHGTVATLKGRVVGEDSYKQALELARTTAGVTDVIDLLRVIPRPKLAVIAAVTPTVATARQGDSGTFHRGAVLAAVLIVFGAGGLGALWGYQTLGNGKVAAAPSPPPRPKVVPVQGVIYYEGRPAAEARLVFHPYGNHDGTARRAHAVADRQGRFQVSTFGTADGAVPGSYVVTVDWIPPCPPGGNEEKYADLGNVAPKRFQHIDSTPLRVRVADAAGGVKLQPLTMSRAYDGRTTH